MPIYRTFRSWLEASARAISKDVEPKPEGNKFSQAEHAHSYTATPEPQASDRGPFIDDDDGGAYRHQPVGFTRQ